MNASRAVLASFLLCSAVACGAVTLEEVTPPSHEDAGAGSGSGTGSQGDDAGAPAPPTTRDAGRGIPLPGVDAAVPIVDASSGVGCVSDGDCKAGELCMWPVSVDYCAAFNSAGTCVKLGPVCNDIPQTATGCGCNGQDVTWTWGCGAEGQPPGYAPEGLAHAGPCADATAPAACTSNADCPDGEECGYEISLGCAATARCVPGVDFGMCNCVGIPECACDGTTEYVSCCSTYASKPVAYEGACAGTDGGL
jgi:hypothetical protein